MNLEEIQARFWRLMKAPTGVKDGLEIEKEDDPEVAPLSGWVVADDEEGAVRRLDVYANMYFFRILDILKGDFPKVLHVVGEDAFHNLVTDYVHRRPPSDPSVRNLGRRLPEFIAEHGITEAHPYLPDLARLEWSWNDVFDAVDEPLLTADHLGQLPPNLWPELELHTISALALIDVAYPVHRLMLAIQQGEPGSGRLEMSPESACVLVYRRDFSVKFRALRAEELRPLREARAGVPFPKVCDYLTQPDDHDPLEVGQRAQKLLVGWLEERILKAVLPSADAKKF